MKTLYVKDFGPVKEATVELRDVNLFIGEQSIGKSTLAKLITIFTDHLSLCKLIWLKDDAWLEQLNSYNLVQFHDSNYHIHFEMDYLKDNHTNIFHVDISQSLFDCYVTSDGTRTDDLDNVPYDIFNLKPIYHHEKWNDMLNTIKDTECDSSVMQQMESLMNNSMYVPAERIIASVVTKLMPALTLAKSSIPENLLRFMVDFQNAKSKYSKFEIPLLNISYENVNSDDYFIVKENGRKYPLTSASSGIQSTLPLLLVLHYAIHNREYSSFVVEEPECNLFPEKQVELLRYIIKSLKAEHRTLTITTHSPYLLSAMNNFLFAGMLASKGNDIVRDSVDKIVGGHLVIQPGTCSVYALGSDINEEGYYCKSLLDDETGMIDFNSLDQVSILMSDEFERLEDVYIKNQENNGDKD